MSGSWLDRNRHLIFILFVCLAAGGAGLFYLRQPPPSVVEIVPSQATATPLPTPLPTATPTPAPVRVYITGAVVHSDVYFLPAGSIIKDVIAAAGGFTADADLEHINQALEVQDQQQIHVPRQGEVSAPLPPVQGGLVAQASAPSRSPAPVSQNTVINLNTASLEELDSLPGIGPAIAQRIIEYRETAGGFKNVEQITEVSGIGEATLAKIKARVTVQ
jgi:competence protein ComEA